MQFTELNLHPCVMKGINDAGFTECTPVQEATLPKTLSGTDAYIQSQTGTGKTAAFLITIFNRFLTGEYRHKKALVLTPTRELAVQVEQDARHLGKHCGLMIGCFYGGVGYAAQDQLLTQNLNLFIGTPGRLIDYQKSGKIDFMKFEVLVIDEADRMFDMGFIPDIRYMIRRMPQPKQRLTMLFSATLSQRVKQLAWEYMNEPIEIEIHPEKLTVDLITQELYHIGKVEKFNLLLGLLRAEKPKSALIFTNMKRTAERVSRRLTANGVRNDYISGDLPQSKRLKIIDAIKSGETEILVATDVAGRGLHIEELDMVINYDLPEDPQNYVHRIGRTARAGKSGKAISLACEEDVFYLEPIEKLLGMKIPISWANETLIVANAAGAPHYEREPRRQIQKRRGERDARGGMRGKKPREGVDRSRSAVPVQQRQERQRPERVAAKSGVHHDRGGGAASQQSRQSRDDGQRKKKNTMKGPDQSTHQRTDQRKDQRKDQRTHQRTGPRTPGPGGMRLKKDATPEERLEYYRIKYGDNFEKVEVSDSQQKKPKPDTLVGSIKKLFGKISRKK
jgi:ATP-dependent RNA helicase RhlB